MKRWRTWVLVALIAWILVVTWWATQPVSDSISTGVINNVPTSQSVQCDSPLSGNTKPTSPPPNLRRGREYERTPCELPITNDRIIFGVDIVFVLIGFVVLAMTWKPAADTEPAESPEAVSVA